MQSLDYIVLIAYFLVMAGIGIWSMRRIKKQEDYFLGGRSFGKWLQAFAAFGAGTGSSDPINTARTSFTSGLSGMWSIMSWLFVTPFYWIAGVWYRRMRHTTLGDWYVERYDSKALGAAYSVFGILFYMIYIAMLFTAIGKVAAPLMGDTAVLFGKTYPIGHVLIPIIAVIIMIYGVLGGLTAAYWTDLIQGICIILLSVLLIPFGLNALVEKFGDPATMGVMDGFRIMHEQAPSEFFLIFGSSNASDFPVYRIAAVALTLMIGIMVTPHFIATGGGSAKTETNARVGLVVGNFAKRFCTIGWAITALIAVALLSDSPELAADPDKTWGIASRELLAPGLVGLMMACLLAALMSSVDCYMIVCGALIVKNVYQPFINPKADERQSLLMGRITSVFILIGSIAISLKMYDAFRQLQLTWIFPLLFAAPFWVGMYWRKATKAGAWATFTYSILAFFLIPYFTPRIAPSLYESQKLCATNNIVVTTTKRVATPSDVAKRAAQIENWKTTGEGQEPRSLQLGESITDTFTTGGKAIFWGGGVTPVGEAVYRTIDTRNEGNKTVVTKTYDCELKGTGNLTIDYFLYQLIGVDLPAKSNAMLDTLSLLPKIIAPFLVMILVSLFTRKTPQERLDRYYAKMRTPVDPDPDQDEAKLEAAYAHPNDTVRRKLFPGTDLEFQKPTRTDLIGFGLCFATCFFIIWLAAEIAGIGA